MPVTNPSVAGVEKIVEQQVTHRTWGRIHRLQVELTNNGVLVRGVTSTHYLKQLALLGATEAIGLASSSHVELDIRVGEYRGGLGASRIRQALAIV